jgi:RNA polymerase primary sigma factor
VDNPAVAPETLREEVGGIVVSVGGVEREATLRPLFRMALVKGSAPTVLLHLRRGAGLSDRDDRGLTPLMLAASAGRSEICDLLLSEGADRAERSPAGLSAADLALAAGHHALSVRLAYSGEQTSTQSSDGDHEPRYLDAIDAEGWEAEEDAVVGKSTEGLLSSVRFAQAGLERVLPDATPDWSEVELVLPSGGIDRPMSAALRRWIVEALQGLQTPANVRRVSRRLAGLASLLEEAGVVSDGEPLEIWVRDVLNARCEPDRPDSLEQERLEAIECLVRARGSDELRRQEIDRLPYLDRATEQSLFRALEEARHRVLRGLLNSSVLIDASEIAESDEEAEDEAGSDFSSILTRLRRLNADEALAQLSQVDLDVGLVEEVIGCLDRRGDPGGAVLRLQLRRYLTARDRAVLSGLPWVERSARRYVGRGVDLGDLCQAGAIGLMRAAERFDASFGYRFQTFSVWWIRQSCARLVADQANTIRMPVHVQDARARFRRTHATLRAEGVVAPGFAQVAERAELTVEAARRALRPRRQYSLSRPDLGRWAARRPCPDSDPLVSLIEKDRRRLLSLAVAELPDREADIVRRRFGLDGFEEETLEDIGLLYGVTRERIRQVEGKALWRLEHSAQCRTLRTML